MYVKNIDNNCYPSFKARRVAIAKVKLPNRALDYDIYELSSKDRNFVENLKSKIDLRALWLGLKNADYSIWNHITNQALSVDDNSATTLLLMQQDKPCGALNARTYWGRSFLEYISTWPIEPNKRLPLAGKTLILQLFKKVLASDSSEILLNSIKDDPFGALEKYLSLNFESTDSFEECEILKIEKENILLTLNMYSELIELTSVDEEEIDLVEKFEN